MRVRSGKDKVGLVEEINGCDRAGEMKTDVGKSLPETGGVMALAAKDGFYEKLAKLNESSGLTLLFNFRQTSMDLYKFYEEVTRRGGYHQVTKDKKWDEVASSINPKVRTLLPDQIRKIYENLLFPFEQIHHYRTSIKDPAKVDFTLGNTSSSGDCSSCLNRKRKRSNNSPASNHCYGAEQLTSAKRKHKTNKPYKSSAGQRSIKETSVEDEDIKTKSEAPVRPRSAYQIFLTKECERLKSIHGENSESINTRDLAIEAWRKLSVEKRKPYIEESERDKERFNRETKTYNKEKNNPDLKPQNLFSSEEISKKSSLNCIKMMWPFSDGDYHVTVEPDPENINAPNESDIELALKLMKNERVNDTVFQVNLEEFWSGDFIS